jgi:hypothetical protein
MFQEVAADSSAVPGVVLSVQSYGDRLNLHPHIRAIASRGVWSANGSFESIPALDAQPLMLLFHHHVIKNLPAAGQKRKRRRAPRVSVRSAGLFSSPDFPVVFLRHRKILVLTCRTGESQENSALFSRQPMRSCPRPEKPNDYQLLSTPHFPHCGMIATKQD